MPCEKEKVNAVLLALAGSNAEPELDLDFNVSDKEALKARAIEAAVKNACSRAKIIAQSAGLQLGCIVSIDYGFSEVRIHHQNLVYDADMQMESMAAPDLDPESVTATDHVNITWEVAGS
jgi:hypothetical protein